MFDSFLRIISGYHEAGPDQAVCMSCVVWCGVVWCVVPSVTTRLLVTITCYECSAQKTVNMTPAHYIYQYCEIIDNLKEDSSSTDNNNVIKLQALIRERYLKN